jgi:redox-sensitive bicupin YhaK (pirin superfamily)
LHLQQKEDDMPAVTADTLTLPRVAAAGLGDTERPVKQITTGPKGYEGEGFPVVRAFAGVSMRDLDPFVHMDQMGEVDYAPGEPRGTNWHPHRGFETVTYMIDGTFQHQDSHGGGGVINDGATQWMTAGAGILHIETPPESLVMSGGVFHGLQLWVNLPAKDKFSAPAYQAIEGEHAALVASADGGALIRIVAGEIDGNRGPGSTHTPITMAHATIQPGAQLSLPWQAGYNALAYVLSGKGTVGTDRRPIHGGQLAVFGGSRESDMIGTGDRITIAADEGQDSNRPALEVVLLGGRPIGEPVAHYGPFVMNTKAELIQAIEDFQSGRLGVVPENALMPHTG